MHSGRIGQRGINKTQVLLMDSSCKEGFLSLWLINSKSKKFPLPPYLSLMSHLCWLQAGWGFLHTSHSTYHIQIYSSMSFSHRATYSKIRYNYSAKILDKTEKKKLSISKLTRYSFQSEKTRRFGQWHVFQNITLTQFL
jgi:hypothetical protein